MRALFPLVLVDQELGHVWKPRLHEIATAVHDVVSAETSFLSHSLAHGYHFELGKLEALDLAGSSITLAPVSGPDGKPVLPRREISYGRLVLALGSDANDFGTPGVREHCHFLNSTADAERIRQRLLALLMRVARGVQDDVSIAIVGGGATGIELAAEIYHSLDSVRTLEPQIRPEQMNLTVLEAGQRVLGASPPEQSEYATGTLLARGIRLMTGSRVRRADAAGLHLDDGQTVAADLVVWAAGVRGPALLSSLLGLPLSSTGRVLVDGHLQCVHCPGVFALGDCAQWTDPRTGQPAPYTAQVASAQARYLAALLARGNPGGPNIPPFRFASKGSVVSLGEDGAVGNLTTRFGQDSKGALIQGLSAKWVYGLLLRRHEVAVHGWGRAAARLLVEKLQRTYQPRIKLH